MTKTLFLLDWRFFLTASKFWITLKGEEPCVGLLYMYFPASRGNWRSLLTDAFSWTTLQGCEKRITYTKRSQHVHPVKLPRKPTGLEEIVNKIDQIFQNPQNNLIFAVHCFGQTSPNREVIDFHQIINITTTFFKFFT